MNSYTMLADDVLSIQGNNIRIDVPGNFELYKNRDDVLYMAKGKHQIMAYSELASLFESQKVKNCFELGIFRGGSAVFLHQLFELPRLVCVDRSANPIPALEEYKLRYPSLSTHYGVDQADAGELREIITSEFGQSELDLAIDDASHLYGPSRTSFETIFPYLRPGGLYVIEDWPWAHQPDAQQANHFWADQPALTNLIIELTIAFAAHANVFSRMYHCPGITWIERGHAPLPKDGTFNISDFVATRNKPLLKI